MMITVALAKHQPRQTPPCTHPLAFLLQTRGRRYLINFIRIGTLVLFVHDVPDIFAYAIKFVVDTGNAPLILTFYFALLAVWGYVRLFVFPVWLVPRVWVEGGGAGKGLTLTSGVGGGRWSREGGTLTSLPC